LLEALEISVYFFAITRSAKDLKGLVFQYLDPGGCISRVLPWILANPELRADDHACYLRAQLFSSVPD